MYVCVYVYHMQTDSLIVKNVVIYSVSGYGNTSKPVEGLSVNS